ncbi:MAG: hypothetical protein GY729_20110 [Desulfobacteraceae bacterium]|nr:hypothetical protein [Desulfobacteraceae bacterium]
MTHIKNVFLKPGELVVSPTPVIIQTVLGSCVAVCLLDIKSGCGGMNHFMLPRSSKKNLSYKYGDYAIAQLISQVSALTGNTHFLVAKIFGGASILKELTSSIGEKNINLSLSTLKENGIKITARDIGGAEHRTIHFDTSTGRVRMYRANKSKTRIMLPVAKQALGKQKILVLDDMISRMVSLKMFLQQKGYKVAISSDPDAVLKKQKQSNMDVLIANADSAVKKVDGIYFYVSCKDDNTKKDVTVVVHEATGSLGKVIFDNGYADYYLDRINTEADLNKQIGNLLKAMFNQKSNIQ